MKEDEVGSYVTTLDIDYVDVDDLCIIRVLTSSPPPPARWWLSSSCGYFDSNGQCAGIDGSPQPVRN